MRVLRRIAGSMRFERCETDVEVRWKLKVPSLECILAKARLQYLRRLLVCRPRTLMAFLSARIKGEPLPWVRLVLADMRALKASVPSCQRLPDPATEPVPWFELMERKTEWSQALACFNLVEFHTNDIPACNLRDCAHAKVKCTECERVFSNEKAFLAHQRAKHGMRVEQRFFSNFEGICQVCKGQFHTHARLLRHLTDRRRTTCWAAIQNAPAEFIKLSEQEVTKLDTWYRDQKRLASQQGHSHILSSKPARTASGKCIGHVSR